jgi:copper chaperone CopZ
VYVRLALVLSTILLVGCTQSAAALPPPHLVQSVPSAELAAGQEEVSMEVIELMCRPCAAQIVGHTRELPGVTSVTMELSTKTLTVRFDMNLTERDSVIASVEQIVANIQ